MNIETTLGVSRKVAAYFEPSSIEDLEKKFLPLRRQYKNISITSTGHNWGYGCNAPNADEDLLISLSKCNQISNFDSYHGTLTVQPGVTYGQLADFLKAQGDSWIAPVHGGGPNCSVLGNILERGYGITPYADHFGALLSLRAILNDGSIYESPLRALGQEKLSRLFRYGVGPYFDGLFTQSGLGIVTEVSLRLARKPEYAEMFYFNIYEASDLTEVVQAIKKSKQELGSTLGGINLMNPERILSMLIDFPMDKIKSGEALSEAELEQHFKNLKLTPWLVVGMIYGPEQIVNSAKKIIRSNFSSIKKRSLFYNSKNRKYFYLLGKILNLIGYKKLNSSLEALSKAYELLLGKPSNVALKLAYWKNENQKAKFADNLDPQRDNCGLIWYAPLVEMQAEKVCEYVEFVRAAAKKFNLNPLITLTTIDELCFDSTVPIVFNKNSAMDSLRAKEYYQYLYVEGAKRGFFPYRLSIEAQKHLQIENSFFKIPKINKERYK